MLQGFADDSGSDGLRAPFVLAGFLLSAEKWASFSDDWHSQLRRQPTIEYFKMKEAADREGQFAGMSDEFMRCKINDLLGVLERHDPDGIHSFLNWSDYREIIQPHVTGRLKNPYQILFPGIFDALLIYQKRKGIFPELTDIDFDEQGSAGHFAQQVYPLMKAHAPEEIKPMLGRVPLMLDDKKVMPLQAADMLAWNLRRELDPDDHEKKWHWLYEKLNKFVWLGAGFSPASFHALLTWIPE